MTGPLTDNGDAMMRGIRREIASGATMKEKFPDPFGDKPKLKAEGSEARHAYDDTLDYEIGSSRK